MSLFLDNKFLSLLSPYLSHFKKVGENLYNFRCPICGDSRISESKARGYIYQRHDKNGLSLFVTIVERLIHSDILSKQLIQI